MYGSNGRHCSTGGHCRPARSRYYGPMPHEHPIRGSGKGREGMAYIGINAHTQTFEVSCGVYKDLDNRPYIRLHSGGVVVHLSIEEAEDLVPDIRIALADCRAAGVAA